MATNDVLVCFYLRPDDLTGSRFMFIKYASFVRGSHSFSVSFSEFGDYLRILIKPVGYDSNYQESQAVLCGIRVMRENVILYQSDVKYHYAKSDKNETGANVMSMADLWLLCAGDGVITMALFTPTTKKVEAKPSDVPSKIDYGSRPIGTVADAVFKDLKITCHDEYVLDCNKFVVARESEVMLKALTDLSSKESQTNTFNIGLDCATPESTRLFIDCMYEGWVEKKMDGHVNEILQLAHCYECPRIIEMVADRMTRNLTKETFWKACGVAVLLVDSQPGPLSACALFANATQNRWNELVTMSEVGTDNTVVTVMKTIAELNKEK